MLLPTSVDHVLERVGERVGVSLQVTAAGARTARHGQTMGSEPPSLPSANVGVRWAQSRGGIPLHLPLHPFPARTPHPPAPHSLGPGPGTRTP